MPFIHDKKYAFDVQLHWQGGQQGIITAHDVRDTIRVATPPEFDNGVPDMWSPEHLFLSSLASCLMVTAIGLAHKKGFAFSRFECRAEGHVEINEGRLRFSSIALFPKVYVSSQEETAQANEVLIQSYSYCIIANSIATKMVHQGEIIIDKRYQQIM